MDAGITHSPALIPDMVRRMEEGHDVVIASRYPRGSKVVRLSVFRHVMSYGARMLFQLAFPIPGVREKIVDLGAHQK